MREIVIIFIRKKVKKTHKCARLRYVESKANCALYTVHHPSQNWEILSEILPMNYIFKSGITFYPYTFQSNKNASEQKWRNWKTNRIKSITHKRNSHKWNSKPSRELKKSDNKKKYFMKNPFTWKEAHMVLYLWCSPYDGQPSEFHMIRKHSAWIGYECMLKNNNFDQV